LRDGGTERRREGRRKGCRGGWREGYILTSACPPKRESITGCVRVRVRVHAHACALVCWCSFAHTHVHAHAHVLKVFTCARASTPIGYFPATDPPPPLLSIPPSLFLFFSISLSLSLSISLSLSLAPANSRWLLRAAFGRESDARENADDGCSRCAQSIKL
jgi:hypothetical protein